MGSGSKEFENKRKRNESGESTTSTDSFSKYIPTPPDGGWGWVVVLASFIVHIVVDGITFTFGVFYMEFLDYFGESKGKTALVGSLLAGFYLMSGPIASALVNRYSCRTVCVFGSIISSLAFFLATFSPNLNILMLTYGCLGGFGFGMMYLPSVIIVSYYFEKKRALATGIAVCGAGVGGFIFAPVGRLMLTAMSWKNALYCVAGVTLNGVICGLLYRPLEPKKKPRRKNVFDRLREKMFGRRNTSVLDDEVAVTQVYSEDIANAVQEAKLAREQRLKDEEGSDIGSLPNSCVTSLRRLDGRESRSSSVANGFLPSRQNSVSEAASPVGSMPVPNIVINEMDEESKDDANNAEDGEKAAMLKKDEEPKMANGIADRKSSGGVAALPPHMRREMSIDATKNGSLPSVPNGMMIHSAGDISPMKNGHLNAYPDGKLANSLSVGNMHVLIPRKRKILPEGVEKEDFARPLYRRDIFYSGSVLHIPQFRSQPNVNKYVASITAIPSAMPPEKESKCWNCVPIPKTAKDILKQMLDISLLKDPVFLIACLGELFGFIGLFIPFVYVAERSIALGVPATKASFLLSVIGITNTIGRILSGWLADFRRVNSLLLHNVMMIVGGIACIANMWCTTFPMMIAFAAIFGLCVATYISLTSIILCELMGLERLTSAFGFLTMVRGIASVAGPPVAGMVFDATNDYDMSFHVGGAMFIIAGLFYCILHLPCFKSKSQELDQYPPMEDVDVQQVIVTPPDENVKSDETQPLHSNQDVSQEYKEVDLGDASNA